MQYLYALTSAPKDNYYEQFLLSVFSLKRIMPNASVILLCDLNTKKNLTGNRGEYEKFVSGVVTADVPASFSQIEVSRWIKTSMRRLVKGDFLFIDCDTIITGDLSSISELGITFGACLDKHLPINKHDKKEQIISNDKSLGFSSYTSNMHYNSGVIYCADTPETQKIFERWHELWLFCKSKKIIRDQPSFNAAIHENQSFFTELDGKWNCQAAYNGLPYLSDSKIIHYFATDMTMNELPYLLAKDNIFNQIKNNGIIPEDTVKLLENPRSAFVSNVKIVAGSDMLYVLNSNLFQSIYLLKRKAPLLFNFFNGISTFIKKITKLFITKSGKNKKYYN